MSKKTNSPRNDLGINYAGTTEKGYKHVFTVECVDSRLSNLKGEVLTIIDATIVDPRQLKAVKDLIHGRFFGTRWDLISIAANENPDAYGDYGLLTASSVGIDQ